MINNNKILTVSYGTFSCTLEGFDDSFETMKAIAEYFRDLAADDRYFGAEPPQPDADMLARIAGREMSRRVEASEHEGRILLKAHEETARSDAPAAEPAPVPPVAASAVASETAGSAPWQGTYSPAPQPPEDPAHLSEAEPAQPFAIDTAHSAPVGAEAPSGADEFFAAGIPVPAAGTTPAETGFEDEVDTPPGPVAETARAPGADSITDRLARIRAVVSRQVVVTETTGIYDEEESVPAAASAPSFEAMGVQDDAELPQDDGVAVSEDPLSAVARDIESALDADDHLLEQADSEDEAEEEDDLSAVLSRIEAGATAESDMAASVDASDDTEDDSAQGGEDQITFSPQFFETAEDDETDQNALYEDDPEMVETDADGFVPAPEEMISTGRNEDLILTEDELTEDDLPEQPENDDTLTAEDRGAAEELHQDAEDLSDEDDEETFASEHLPENAYQWDDTADDAPDAENVSDAEERQSSGGSDVDDEVEAGDPAEEPIAEDEEPALTGRVMKVSASELEDALETGELEELSEDDKAGDEARDQSDTDAHGHAGRANLPDISGVSGDDVTRLMAEADQQMEEPEGATRRSAFAHLRAAVAARFADKTMGSDAEAEETAEAYRSDLAEVVRPRRPVSDGIGTNRPTDKSTAPLKLVAEQRVDTDDARGPVAPRRIAATVHEDEELSEDTGFAAFASEMGATSLPDLLEAAAAYMSFVEGQEDFSRPQLMTRVRQASEGSEFTREDGLRSFGQLLRSGKIEKMKGGRFAASEDIGFKPDARAAG
ncbi:hypothetical protein [Roseobacter ponti]|uniref:Lipoprotein n=1 Tax=Roseobacter ponti TaxID=1891787 RepID=A0A858STP3_9RHOB|nr:hypothetical protein [Roseobacter ponti]QJF52054.1 hypothetical protein G3256_13200 [Roseobacter ponti]